MDETHEAMVESSLSLLFATYDEAIQSGVDDPVLFLVDCEDVIGGEIARAWAGDEAVEDAVVLERAKRDAENDATTVLARAVPWADCRQEVPAVFPYLAAVFENEPETGGFLVLSVTDGGAAVFTVPLERRDDRG